MEDKRLNAMHGLFAEIAMEAKMAFVEKFSYLKILYADIDANKLVRSVTDTDGSILVGLECRLVIPFSMVKEVLFDIHIAYFNYELGYIYSNGKITLTLKRFYYHTEKKFIFSI